ncbi:MAG: hypothetical protein IPO49_12785 [Bacteroidetes bacterium]|nr:hypothetical protein [Bacteroidota bacterium]
MKSIYILGLLLFSLNSLGQKSKLTDEQLNSSGANKLIFIDNINQADSLAKIDINKGIPFLLLQSGISPVGYTTDSRFEEKYKVYYFESGCTGPNEMFASEYNGVIFEYLTNKFGKKWMREIRKDVIGYKIFVEK